VLKTITLTAASLAGKATRLVTKSGAGIVGAGLISAGLGMVYGPLLYVAAGGFLLILDRKAP
jgi:hypothetical protein